jgi:hypothetical protein
MCRWNRLPPHADRMRTPRVHFLLDSLVSSFDSFSTGLAMNRMLIVGVVAGWLCTPGGYCADGAPSQDKDNFAKRAAKVIGHDAKTGAKQAGQAFKDLGKDIGHGTSKAVKDIGHGMKQSAERTGKQAKDAAK